MTQREPETKKIRGRMKKKKILFHSDFSLAKTGFGRNCRALLSYLYKTNKYDIVNYCCGTSEASPDLIRTPWKSIGCLPSNATELSKINSNKDPQFQRDTNYGAYLLDKTIAREKPDVYIAVQDIWGVEYATKKPWFDKINSVIWTTLDSLPIYPNAIKIAPKIKNYWIWSSFATKRFHELKHTHVRTMHGAIDESSFSRLTNDLRLKHRNTQSITDDTFVIGFVFRNQLRKSVPNLLEGYSLFKKKNPDTKTRLLFHTHWKEGWNIHKLADEYKIDKSEILTTYICKACRKYEIKEYTGQDERCGNCDQKTLVTPSVACGVTEQQLSEIYNLMDAYCHPFTSGGQEIPIQEAKLSGVVTLVTNYSCGEESCEEGSGTIPLDWAEYREHGTEFRKASTLPLSIAEKLDYVLKLDPKEKFDLSETGRNWALDNFSLTSVGKQVEDFLDSCEPTEFNFLKLEEKKNLNQHATIPDIEDNSEWLIYMYKHILGMEVDGNDQGHKYWTQQLSNGQQRQNIENYFRKVASEGGSEEKELKLSEILGKEDEGKRIIYVMPDSEVDVFLSTALFKSLKELYPDCNLYVATKKENQSVLDMNPHVHAVIDYMNEMDDALWLEGRKDHKGFFEIGFLPYVNTQRISNYSRNGKDKIAFDIKY